MNLNIETVKNTKNLPLKIFIGFCVVGLIATIIIVPILLKKDKCEKGSGCNLKNCGYDSCGNIDGCGKCSKGTYCNEFGICTAGCDKDCGNSVCGDDPCGNPDGCGFCGQGESCVGKEGEKICCKQQCDSIRPCGPDGCGGTCGTGNCSEYKDGSKCYKGACCIPDCLNKDCGDDACGGSCGTCKAPKICKDGKCICPHPPDCKNKTCGDDTCGGSCGTCKAGTTCKDGNCVCAPNCKNKTCGDDTCGGSCGTCKENETCVGGVCKCGDLPSCTGDNRCVKGVDGKFKCCPPSCSKFSKQQCGVDDCSGEKCYCPIGFGCENGNCVCGPNKKVCSDINTMCIKVKSDLSSCFSEFYINTEYGFLSSTLQDVGNGLMGILLFPPIYLANALFTYTDRKYLEMVISNKKKTIYVDYEGKGDQMSFTKGAYLTISKNNTLMYKKPGHGARFYLGIYKNSKGIYYAMPGKAYSGFILTIV